MDTLHSPDAFFLSLDDAPGDRDTALVLADWYEERGEVAAAAALRWAIGRGLHPFRYNRKASSLAVHGPSWNDGWYWWAVEGAYWAEWGHPRPCQLPRKLWDLLPHSFAHEPSVFKEYPTRRAAYEALFAAFPAFSPYSVRAQRGRR